MPSFTRPLTAVLAALLAAGVLAACGGDDSGSDTASAPATTEQTTTQATTQTETEGGETETQAADAEGEQLFTENCASCHTLAAADASGQVGPNLDDAKPSAATVEAKVKAGGGGMPAFEGQLSDAQITALAAYVSENAGES